MTHAPQGRGSFHLETPMTTTIETLAALLRRYCDDQDEPRDVPRVSLADAVRQGDDPLHILPYFAGLGIAVRSLDDLLRINDDDAEEEIRSFRVAEGVAVTVASDSSFMPVSRATRSCACTRRSGVMMPRR